MIRALSKSSAFYASIFALLSLFAASTYSQAPQTNLPQADFKEAIKGGLATKGQIIAMREIPLSKLYFVEAEQGNYMVSSDGRFVFEGTLKDVWHRRTIKTAEDVRQTERTPVGNLGFKPEEQLAYFTIGDPKLPRQGVAFVDPTSTYTTQFLKQLYEMENEVNWTVVLMPLVGGNTAVDRSLRLHCATDQDQAKLDFIYGSSHSFGRMKEGCDDEKILLAMMLTDVFRIKSLPHLIREDGLMSDGLPVNFADWFKQP
jgi:thiol:disulfide interchange protein DsbC